MVARRREELGAAEGQSGPGRLSAPPRHHGGRDLPADRGRELGDGRGRDPPGAARGRGGERRPVGARQPARGALARLRCALQRPQLEARGLRAGGGAALPPPRRRAPDPLLAPVSAHPGAGKPPPGPLLPARADHRVAGVAAVHPGGGSPEDPGRPAPLLQQALQHDGARSGDRGHGVGDGRHRGRCGKRPARGRPRGARGGRRGLRGRRAHRRAPR